MSHKIQQFINQHSNNGSHTQSSDVVNIEKYKLHDDIINADVSGRNITSETLKIPKFIPDSKKLIDKSVIFYGPSGSGKTQIIYDFMYELRDYFPKVIVFAPTNREKRDYDGYVPTELIYEDFGLEEIKTVYESQRAAARAYNIANDLKILQQLANKVMTVPQKTFLRNLLFKKNKALEQINMTIKELPKRKAAIKQLEEAHEKHLIKFFKEKVIWPNRNRLQGIKMSENEKICVKYIKFNPRLLVVFDDSMTEILSLIKKGRAANDNVLLDFFYKGRWAYITHFYAFQDDNRLDSEIKKNAFYSVFTRPNVANAFFNRAATSFSPQDKARAKAAINEVFPSGNDDNVDHKYRKLLYAREEKDNFQHITADVHEDFEMCSAFVRQFCKNAKKKDDEEDKNNPYFTKFAH